ncbi:hypothetical protein [Paenibacillus sp. IHBB 10380]|uniref:hypothetical protein n=1 Tax=Paenibacillus sp. IHBB 10380 TaxID=1566358 RepID=UPI0005CFC799|nr:hypothetical protein [Paenibacillus sp. IHBB 10380]AJS58549.1 hypothetical protein UB51_08655 [Paenibacillus sp. IHBB 10380]
MQDKTSPKYYPFVITAVLIFALDLIYVFAHFNNYSVNLFTGSGYIIPLIINIGFLMFIAFAYDRWWLYIVPSFLCVLLGMYIVFVLLFNSIVSWQYDNIHSPKRTETLMIKHRSASLGETTFIYEFYRKSFMGLLLTKLDRSDLEIMLRDTHDKKAMDLLNIQSPTWVNETEVILHTLSGDKTIILE